MELKKIWEKIKDYVFPVHCLGCEEEGIWLCSNCKKKIDITGCFYCPICHKQSDLGKCCEECKQESSLDSHIAISKYDENNLIGKVIQTLKYSYAEDVSKAIEDIIKDFLNTNYNIFSNIDLIVPVPLHKKRYVQRGFNQSDIIANLVFKNLDKKKENILERIRHTGQQAKLKREERLKNLSGAFKLKNNIDLKNKNILLVDDVFTTGSTLQECAKVLKDSGVSRVVGFSVARG